MIVTELEVATVLSLFSNCLFSTLDAEVKCSRSESGVEQEDTYNASHAVVTKKPTWLSMHKLFKRKFFFVQADIRECNSSFVICNLRTTCRLCFCCCCVNLRKYTYILDKKFLKYATIDSVVSEHGSDVGRSEMIDGVRHTTYDGSILWISC